MCCTDSFEYHSCICKDTEFENITEAIYVKLEHYQILRSPPATLIDLPGPSDSTRPAIHDMMFLSATPKGNYIQVPQLVFCTISYRKGDRY